MQEQAKDCVFCKIVSGEIPDYRIWEDDNFVAFLDINPVQPYHILIVPKMHIDHVYDLPEEIYKKLFLSGRKLAPILKEASGAIRVGMSVIGIDIPHTHLHLIPVKNSGDMDHAKARPAKKEELERMQSEIKKLIK